MEPAVIAASIAAISSFANLFYTRWTANKVEALRSQNAERLEHIAQINRFHLAALGKRLEAYQKAFALAFNLRRLLDDPNIEVLKEHAKKCEEWWIGHCLYLDEGTARNFSKAVVLACEYRAVEERSEEEGISKEDVERRKRLRENVVETVRVCSISLNKLYFCRHRANARHF